MRLLKLLILCFIPFLSNGQRTITGKVISENEWNPIPNVTVQSHDSQLLGTTDLNGNIQLELSNDTDHHLIFSSVGMERSYIIIPGNCDHFEIIMMTDIIYDFITIKKENRMRYRRFKNLGKQHRKAYEQGIFVSIFPCAKYIFKNQ